MITPKDYVGKLMELAQQRRGEFIDMQFLTEARTTISYDLPLAEVWHTSLHLPCLAAVDSLAGLCQPTSDKHPRTELGYRQTIARSYGCRLLWQILSIYIPVPIETGLGQEAAPPSCCGTHSFHWKMNRVKVCKGKSIHSHYIMLGSWFRMVKDIGCLCIDMLLNRSSRNFLKGR